MSDIRDISVEELRRMTEESRARLVDLPLDCQYVRVMGTLQTCRRRLSDWIIHGHDALETYAQDKMQQIMICVIERDRIENAAIRRGVRLPKVPYIE